MDSTRPRTVFACSCEDTMVLDEGALARGCGGRLRGAEQLCRSQLDRFLAALGDDAVTVGCTQEAPLFRQEAEAAGHRGALDFVNIREQAGWAEEGAQAGPKMAALLAAAAVPMPATPLVPLTSEGVTLVLGRDAAALALAATLAPSLDITVLLTGAEPVEPRASADFPVLRGRARAATGWLGNFSVTVDGYAAAAPSSRDVYRWGRGQDGAQSRCDVILDLTGGPPLFPAHEVRLGYLRADPGDAAAVARLVREAEALVGQFDKPRFVNFDAGLCAHSRNRRTGCTRCLDLCPTGAITPAAPGTGTAWRSVPRSAPDAAPAPPSAPPAPPPTPCRPPTRCCAVPACCCAPITPPAAQRPPCCCTASKARQCSTPCPATAPACRRTCCRCGSARPARWTSPCWSRPMPGAPAACGC